MIVKLSYISLKATKKGLKGKSLIMSNGSTIEERFLSDPRFTILTGSLVVDS